MRVSEVVVSLGVEDKMMVVFYQLLNFGKSGQWAKCKRVAAGSRNEAQRLHLLLSAQRVIAPP
jgi:hypothetical protein